MSTFGRGSPKKPSCKIISKSVKPFWRRSSLTQKVDNTRTTDDGQRLITIGELKIIFLAQRVYVSEILHHFFQLYPTHSRSVYDPTGMILAISYREVPYMLHAKYQPNWHSGSGEEVV